MMKIQNSKILITGGAGFIGSNLANKLSTENEVIVVDDLSMGKTKNLRDSKNIRFYKESITNNEFMVQLLLNENFDYIFLLAAVASVVDTINKPVETHEINQNANIDILNIIRINKLPVKKVLFTSSAAVYGNNPELPKSETSPIDPLSPYAIDKFASERFVIDYGRLYDIPTVATRFFNVYGPKQNPSSPYSGVLSLIIKKLSTDKTFYVYGDGEQTRDFVYVDDVVLALEVLAESTSTNYNVYNVATGIPTTLNKVITFLEEVAEKKLKVVYKSSRLGDIKESYGDISKLRKLDFSPKVSLKLGLKKYWNDLE